ncbi:MAG: AAA-like domain-containing protein [Anaerolineae bacterium]
MSRQADIEQLIYEHNRRLQIRKQQRAAGGVFVDPQIIIEIEDIEAEIDRLQQELETLKTAAPQQTPATGQNARLFISYKRDVEPDESVAREVCAALETDYAIFIDRTMPVGTRWAEQIETELNRADFFIVFLSAQAVQSEMVAGEIIKAHQLAQAHGGRPVILPVRLAYQDPFPYPLDTYLDPINWAFWRGSADTPRLIEDLRRAVTSGVLTVDPQAKASFLRATKPGHRPPPAAAAQPVRLEAPEGTMDPQSAFYIERPGDKIALEAISRQGVTITIKGPRQMGKSSLLMRVIDAATKGNKRVAFLDFQLFDRDALEDADVFFRQFCYWLTDELDLEEQVDKYWQMPLGNSQRCTRYIRRYLLRALNGPLLLAMDEVETIFETDFRSDFFGMLRSWHNMRRPGAIWRQLDLALVTSTEPYQLIDNLNQSPFNVGEVIQLADFSAQQVSDLNRRHNSPLSANQEKQLYGLLGGHPYLIRRALYLVAGNRLAVADIFLQATDDRSPFGDHLRRHLFRLHGQDDLIRGMRQVLQSHTCSDEQVFHRLRGAGLVRRQGRTVLPRCRLYEDFFRKHLP